MGFDESGELNFKVLVFDIQVYKQFGNFVVVFVF